MRHPPLPRTDRTSMSRTPKSDELARDRANILLVDDRPDKHVVYRSILEELGQNLVSARSGEEALREVLKNEFAVILLDVNMPGMDGLETAAMIRGRKRSAHMPIIFITADYGDEVRTAKGYSLGAVDFMVSPIVPEILRTKVKVFVDLYLLAQLAKHQARERGQLAAERTARAAAERANEASAFLARASVALSGSLNLGATTRELARLVVPFLADVGVLDDRRRRGPRCERRGRVGRRGHGRIPRYRGVRGRRLPLVARGDRTRDGERQERDRRFRRMRSAPSATPPRPLRTAASRSPATPGSTRSRSCR